MPSSNDYAKLIQPDKNVALHNVLRHSNSSKLNFSMEKLVYNYILFGNELQPPKIPVQKELNSLNLPCC